MRFNVAAVLVLLSSLALVPKAHAIHAYHSDWCGVSAGTVDKLPFQFRSNYDWMEVDTKTADLGGDTTLTGMMADASKPIGPQDDFQAQKINITNKKVTKYDDGCWEGTEGTYSAVIKIQKVSAKATALGMKVGMEIPVDCAPEDIDPNGSKCE